jgi:T5SS/PEP-CTERM-associated repeat protein
MISGGTVNVGQGVDLGHGSIMTQTWTAKTASGKLVVDGTAKVVIGNSLGEGNAAGVGGAGAISLARYVGGEAELDVQGKAVVKALRLVGGVGAGLMTIKDDAQVSIVNQLGAGTSVGAGTAYNSFLGSRGYADNGDRDGTEPPTVLGRFHLWVQNNAVLDVDANAAGRDPTRPELQGLQLGGNSSIVDVWDNAKLIVRQRLVIGNVGKGASLNGYDGQADRGVPGGAGLVWVTGGLVSADQIVVGGAGRGELDVLGGRAETKAYDATYDPTAKDGAGSATTSVNAIRVGMLAGTSGFLKVWGSGLVSTGELSIGQYGNGTLTVDEGVVRTATGTIEPGTGAIEARDVVFQKFAGSTATFAPYFRGKTFTTVRASNDVTINGGTLQLTADNLPAGAYRWDVLVADSDGDGAGAVSGRFTTVTGSETSSTGAPASGRVFSVVYGPKTVSVGFAYPGDGDYSGGVNFGDLLLLARHYGQAGQWTDGDFSSDGVVNFSDLLLLAKNYNKGVPAPGAVPGASAAFEADVAAAFAVAAVPEPGVAGVLGALALVGVAGRRRRRVE